MGISRRAQELIPLSFDHEAVSRAILRESLMWGSTAGIF